MNFMLEYHYEDGRYYLYTGSGHWQTYNSDHATIAQAMRQAQRIACAAGHRAIVDMSCNAEED